MHWKTRVGFPVTYLRTSVEKTTIYLVWLLGFFSPSSFLCVCRWFVMKTDPVAMALFTLRLTRQRLGPSRP